MSKKTQAQEQITSDPGDKDPFSTKFKRNITGSGGEDRKEDDKKKLKKAVHESVALDNAIDEWMRSREKKKE
jgi:hypothetical protein